MVEFAATPVPAPALTAGATSTTRRPRPFSLATGVGFVTIGVGSIIDTWTPVDAGGVAAVALLLGGLAALVALATRRAPSPPVEQE